MRILILDDDKSYGALLASATKKLGHRGIVTTDPEDAIAALGDSLAEVAFVDLEMPAGSGPECVARMRGQGFDIPTAFCTGTCQDDALIAAASAIGPVLPKVWTHADLRAILDQLQRELASRLREQAAAQRAREAAVEAEAQAARLAQAQREAQSSEQARTERLGKRLPMPSSFQNHETLRDLPVITSEVLARAEESTHHDLPPQNLAQGTGSSNSESFVPVPSSTGDRTLDKASLEGPSGHPEHALAQEEPRRHTPRVRITCGSWQQVRRLCGDIGGGQRTITVRAKNLMEVGDDVVVSLGLPDEMVVSVAAVVLQVRANSEGKTAYQLELTDFGEQELAYLLASCDHYDPVEEELLDETHEATVDTLPKIPITRDSVDLEIGQYAEEARISWSKPKG